MASCAGGYDLKFVSTPSDDLTCLICHSVARDPQQIVCCAKLYCKSCLDELKKVSNSCPTCREPITSFSDKLSLRRVRALTVRCENEDNECEWVGELGNLEEHTTTCEFAVTSCTNNCRKKVLRRDLENHLTNKCRRRKHKCRHCDEEGEYRNMTTAHLEECPHVVVTCPNAGCGVRKKRCDISSHRDSCPKEVVKCSYAKVGCEETMTRESCQEHEATGVEFHLQLAVERIAILEKKVKKPVVVLKMSDFSRNGDWYSEEFYSHPGGYRMTLKVSTNGYKDEHRPLAKWMRDMDRHWMTPRVDDYKENHGYLSVFICLTGGEYDDNLVWPFRGTVTVDLLNQLEDSNHASETIPFTATETKWAKKPPRGDRNGGYGWAKFMSHKELEYTPSTNCLYLKDNCLYFRISNVDLDPANKVRPWLAL